MTVIDIDSQSINRSFALPGGRDRNLPLRVNFDAAGTCIWRDGGPGNAFGYVYTLDLDTDTSTRLVPNESDLTYGLTTDRGHFLFMFDAPHVAIWDAQTQNTSAPVPMPDFGSNWWDWITQGTMNNSATTVLLCRGGSETLVYDGALNLQGITTAMAWGTFGPWENLAIIVESNGGESASERISVLDTVSLGVLDTLQLPETVGVSEYNFGSRPIKLTDDARTLLAA